MQPTASWHIPVGGKDSRGIEWHGDDLPTGITILSATKAVSPATGLTVGNPVVNAAADGISILIEAVTAGAYTVTITATRSDGGKLVEYLYIEAGAVALSAAALVTLDDARNFMGWLPGSHAEDITNLIVVIEAVSATFAGEADPDFIASTAIIETINGTGRSYIYLDRYPITDIDSVVEDGVTLTEDTDYFADYDEGLLEKPAGGKWTTARGGVVVTYDAGYAAVPADVKLACLLEVARKFDLIQKKMFGESTRTQEGVSISVNTDELTPETLATLGRYTRTRI